VRIRQVLWGVGILGGLSLTTAAVAAPELAVIPDYDHGSPVEIQNQSRALRELKSSSPSLDCLFVEVDRSVNASLEDFLGNRASYYGSVQLWINQLENFTGYRFQNVIPANLLLDARGMGLRVYGVDMDLRSPAGMAMIRALRAYNNAGRGNGAGESFVRLGIIERNRVMAKNARLEFANRGCRSAALIVGASHLDNEVDKIPSVSILKTLEQEGFAVSTI
jgi:hypothetical protein